MRRSAHCFLTSPPTAPRSRIHVPIYQCHTPLWCASDPAADPATAPAAALLPGGCGRQTRLHMRASKLYCWASWTQDAAVPKRLQHWPSTAAFQIGKPSWFTGFSDAGLPSGPPPVLKARPQPLPGMCPQRGWLCLGCHACSTATDRQSVEMKKSAEAKWAR